MRTASSERQAHITVPLTVAWRQAARRAGARKAEPVTIGLPLPRGLTSDAAELALYRSDAEVRLQSRVLDRWPDGSMRWVLLDFQADAEPGDLPRYELRVGFPSETEAGLPSIELAENGGGVTVSTGAASFQMSPGNRFPFEQALVAGANAVDVNRSGLRAEDESGQSCTTSIERVSVEERGRLRSVVVMRGHIACSGKRLLDFCARLHFFAGSATVKFALTVGNTRKADHPDGLWDLGDGGSVYIKDLALTLTLPSGCSPDVRWSPDPEAPIESCVGEFELYQDSSGGENWKSSNHLNRHHRVPNDVPRLPSAHVRRRDDGPSGDARGQPVGRRARDQRRRAVVLAELSQGDRGVRRLADPASLPAAVRRRPRNPGRRAEDAHVLRRLCPRSRDGAAAGLVPVAAAGRGPSRRGTARPVRCRT